MPAKSAEPIRRTCRRRAPREAASATSKIASATTARTATIGTITIVGECFGCQSATGFTALLTVFLFRSRFAVAVAVSETTVRQISVTTTDNHSLNATTIPIETVLKRPSDIFELRAEQRP